MVQLTQHYSHSNFNNSLIRIGDLVNLDGPVLSLFEDVRNGHLYIFDWVDRIEKINRWIVYQTQVKILLDFIQKRISYFELFTNPVKGAYYYTDIGINISSSGYNISFMEAIPNKYLPSKNDFFDKADCPKYDTILLFLLNQKSENLYFAKVSNSTYRNNRKCFTRSIDTPKFNTIVNHLYLDNKVEDDRYNNKYKLVAISKHLKRSIYKRKRHASTIKVVF